MYTNGLWVFETPTHLPNIFGFSIAYRCQPLTRSNVCKAWRPVNVYLIHCSIKSKQMKNMTLGETDIRQIAHDWGEFGVFESELSDTKCVYIHMTFCFFGGRAFSFKILPRIEFNNNPPMNSVKLAAVQSQRNQTKLMVNVFSLRVKSFLWRWKYRGQQVLKIQHVWKLFTKPSVNTYHCVHSVENV